MSFKHIPTSNNWSNKFLERNFYVPIIQFHQFCHIYSFHFLAEKFSIKLNFFIIISIRNYMILGRFWMSVNSTMLPSVSLKTCYPTKKIHSGGLHGDSNVLWFAMTHLQWCETVSPFSTQNWLWQDISSKTVQVVIKCDAFKFRPTSHYQISQSSNLHDVKSNKTVAQNTLEFDTVTDLDLIQCFFSLSLVTSGKFYRLLNMWR
jgi:hypothetical protein